MSKLVIEEGYKSRSLIIEVEQNSEDNENEYIINRKRMKAHYYLEAEKHALLSKWGARWLLSYYRENGDIQLTDEDIKRLEARFYACAEDDDREAAVADTVCVSD